MNQVKHNIAQLMFLLVLLFANASVWAVDTSNYRLGIGDRIEIKVYGEPDLSLETTIGDDGTITYPFIGEVKVIGATVVLLEKRITQFLKGDYLVNPNVNVSIKEYRKFYIQGQVRRPGGYPYLPGLTVQKAISLSGGLTERANRKKIYVIPENNQSRKRFRTKMSNQIRPGDIIIVEESFF